jgi:CRISPR-associated protein Cas2
MTVLILERVPASLRGDLTRWLLEPRTGVFVGNLNARVRDKLWEKACDGAKGGACMLIHTTNNEQGYTFRTFNDTSRLVYDWEGLQLVTKPE